MHLWNRPAEQEAGRFWRILRVRPVQAVVYWRIRRGDGSGAGVGRCGCGAANRCVERILVQELAACVGYRRALAVTMTAAYVVHVRRVEIAAGQARDAA